MSFDPRIRPGEAPLDLNVNQYRGVNELFANDSNV